MRYSTRIKPVSFVEENAEKLADILDGTDEPLILTQGGEAKIVVQSVKAYEETQETIAFLQLLTLRLGDARLERGIPVDEVFERVRRRIRER